MAKSKAKPPSGGSKKFDESKHPRGKGGKFTTKTGIQDIETYSGGKVYKEKAVPTKSFISKTKTGDLAEDITILYLRNVLGIKDADFLNRFENNYPVDIMGDHMLIEVKGGVISSTSDRWKVTLGEAGKEIKEYMASLSPKKLAEFNVQRVKDAMNRKAKVVREKERERGVKLKQKTFGLIIHPDKKTADIYEFDGFHPKAITWKSDMAKNGYKTTVTYG